ncbi:hypothetical protein G7092_19960 [Mucilaginibacter sp. HC2]|uniref:hypothetical protein n=1 Tax=Mucilaginibacter inviolabilis TaxID=2714892 RepID=UPI00140D02F5|nr:hypothetical protein [Mucilaginibacter inviolabilis]NHA06096.1 hypothetical protein [Mucilaginibacter inviolabilis]
MKKLIFSLSLFLGFSSFVQAQWTTSGNNIYYNFSGNVGIGVINPANKLDVAGVINTPSYMTSALGFYVTNTQNGINNVLGGNTISFRTGNVDNRMVIDANGNVGIGTTAPASNLHISELSTSKPGGVLAPTKSVFKLSRYGTPNYSYNESAEFRIGHGGSGTSGSQLDLFINGGSNINDIPDQQAMTWLYNGNVGIGTTTPNGKLDIASLTASGKSDVLQRYTWLGDLSNWGLRLEQQFNAPLSSIQYNWIMRQGTSTDIPVMSFAGGNVGINTTDNANWNLINSTYKLAVNGGIIATSKRVELLNSKIK